MGMYLCGIELTDEQMAAINPVINKNTLKSRINKQKMEQDCLEAMKEAGCPLIVPKTARPDSLAV